jgi:hypothetical protein
VPAGTTRGWAAGLRSALAFCAFSGFAILSFWPVGTLLSVCVELEEVVSVLEELSVDFLLQASRTNDRYKASVMTTARERMVNLQNESE